MATYYWTNLDREPADDYTPYRIPKEEFPVEDPSQYEVAQELEIDLADSTDPATYVTGRFGTDPDEWAAVTDEVFTLFKESGGSTLQELVQYLWRNPELLGKPHGWPKHGADAHLAYINDALDYIDNSQFRCKVVAMATLENMAASATGDASRAMFTSAPGVTVAADHDRVPAEAAGARIRCVRVVPPVTQDHTGRPGDNPLALEPKEIVDLRAHATALRRRAKYVLELGAQIRLELRERMALVVGLRQADLLLELSTDPSVGKPEWARARSARAAMDRLREAVYDRAQKAPFGDSHTLPVNLFFNWVTATTDLCEQISYILFNEDDCERLPAATPTPVGHHDFSGFTSLSRKVFGDAMDIDALADQKVRGTLSYLVDALQWSTDALADYHGTAAMAAPLTSLRDAAPATAATSRAALDRPKSLYAVMLAIAGPTVHVPNADQRLPAQGFETVAVPRAGSLLVGLQAVIAAWSLPSCASSAQALDKLAQETLAVLDKAIDPATASAVRAAHATKTLKTVVKLTKRLSNSLEATSSLGVELKKKGAKGEDALAAGDAAVPAGTVPAGASPWVGYKDIDLEAKPAKVPDYGPVKLLLSVLGLAMSVAGTVDEVEDGKVSVLTVANNVVALAEVSALGLKAITSELAGLEGLASKAGFVAKSIVGRLSAIMGIISPAVELWVGGQAAVDRLGLWIEFFGSWAILGATLVGPGWWLLGLNLAGLVAIGVAFAIKLTAPPKTPSVSPSHIILAILDDLAKSSVLARLGGDELASPLREAVAAFDNLELPLIQGRYRGALTAAHVDDGIVGMVCEPVRADPDKLSPV